LQNNEPGSQFEDSLDLKLTKKFVEAIQALQ
jgi:tetratricopeptide (TPR) repeat protein